MELDKALSQISEIRRQMARGEVFRGYRSATTLFSALVALIACAIHALWLPESLNAYLILWLGAAALSLAVVGVEMFIRCRRSDSALQRELTAIAIEQFVPCLVTGGLLTYVMLHYAYQSTWMLPGLWAILFSLGVFASRRVLPGGTSIVGAWYLLSGLLCIVRGFEHGLVPAPWQMGLCFVPGQCLTAFILYWNLERRDEQ